MRENYYIRGASGIMYRTREKNSPLPIDDYSLVIISDAAVDHLKAHYQENQEEEDGET